MLETLERNNSQLTNNSYNLFGHTDNSFYETTTVKIALTIYFSVAMILSLMGNISTCAVIARNRSMRTPTNSYLLNLAVTDIFTVCFIPLDLYGIWIPDFYPFGKIGCRIHFFLWDFVSNCSLLIITAFTVERYVVVTRPFLRQKLTKNSRVFKIVGIIWVVSAAFSIPDLWTIHLLESETYSFCYCHVSNFVSIIIVAEIFVFFIIPTSVIIVMYPLIILELQSAKKKLRNSPISIQQNKDKAVKMGAAVAASFFLSWTPYCILRAMLTMPVSDENYNLWKIINYMCYTTYMSSVANPILYSLMSRKFRQAFKNLLQGKKTTIRKSVEPSTSISISRNDNSYLNRLNLTRSYL